MVTISSDLEELRGQSALGPTLRAADPGAFKGAVGAGPMPGGAAGVASRNSTTPLQQCLQWRRQAGGSQLLQAVRGLARLQQALPGLRSDIQVAAAHCHTSLLPMVTSHSHRPRWRILLRSIRALSMPETLSPSAPLPTLSEGAICVLLGLTLNIGTLNTVIVVSFALREERTSTMTVKHQQVPRPGGMQDNTWSESEHTVRWGQGCTGCWASAPAWLHEERPAAGA